MLGQRLRRWNNVNPIIGLMFCVGWERLKDRPVN